MNEQQGLVVKVKKDIIKKKKTTLKTTKKEKDLCGKRNPKPPCEGGYEEKFNEKGKGETCCYKKKILKPVCNNRNPSPPCAEGSQEKLVTLKDGRSENCCFQIPGYKLKLEAEAKRLEKERLKRIEDDIMLARAAISAALKAEAERELAAQKLAEQQAKQDAINKQKELDALKIQKQKDKALKKAALEEDKLLQQQMKIKLAEQKKQQHNKELQGVDSKNCNKRNPAPPCKDGYGENIRTLADGTKSKCCYKLKKTLKKSCSKRNPTPPCKDGFEKKKTVINGEIQHCCYKKKTLKKRTTLCNKRNPEPPCKNGQVEIKKTKGDLTSTCCYRAPIEKKPKLPKVKMSLFTKYDSLFEFDALGEVKKPENQLPRRIDSSPSKSLLVAPKYDGHRMLYDHVLKIGLSRTGKTKFELPDTWLQTLNIVDTHLDGEIFLRGLPAANVAALRSKSNLSDKLWRHVAEYQIFDLPTHEGDFTERSKEYTKIVKKLCDEWEKHNKGIRCPFVAVKQTLAKTPEEIIDLFKQEMKQTYKTNADLTEFGMDTSKGHPPEGLVLSIPEKKYEFGKSFAKYKFKARYDYDAVVIKPHPLKQSVLVYRADCPKPGEPNSAEFYISTEGTPKEFFLPGDIVKYTSFGFAGGDEKCPSRPKMPKFLSWRTEEMAKQKKKFKPLPAPKDGPNEELAQYFDRAQKEFFALKTKLGNIKGVVYKKAANVMRRTIVKIDLTNYDQVYGKKSLGTQIKCVLDGNSFEECIGNRIVEAKGVGQL
tara:strand:- start:453 stop:2744 length:2292 start_codon:yes stop_codon:yes gene_type:complete